MHIYDSNLNFFQDAFTLQCSEAFFYKYISSEY